MAGLSASYLAKNAVYFEPADREEAEAIQRRLIDLGYSWGVNQRSVSYAQKCVQMGITALPTGRMFCGEPSDFKTVRHTYEELNGEPLLRAAVHKLSTAVQDDSKAIGELRRHFEAETGKLKRSMQAEFDMLGNRQKQIEQNQTAIMAQLDEILTLLRPKHIDLGIKKPGG